MLRTIDWTIMIVYFVFVLGHRFCPQALCEDQYGLLSGGTFHARLDCRAGLSSPRTWARRKSSAWAPPGPSTASPPATFTGLAPFRRWCSSGVFMMPFYYGSRARSVPEYLRLRFDEKTRGLNAISFAVMTRLLFRHFHVCHGQADSDPAHV